MAAESVAVWPEIEKAEKEKRRELVLQGSSVDKKIETTGGVHPRLYSLVLLNYLEISQCPNLHEIREDIKKLCHLQSLVLCRNKITSVPRSIGELRSLKVLDLSVNKLQDLSEEICSLNELSTLNVSCNFITALPDGLSRCTKLCSVNVCKNALVALPGDLFSPTLELLTTIIASENCIEQLNTDIYNLPALKVLDLSNNKLSEIPFELADCSKLKEINFKGNQLKDKRLEKMVNGCQTKSVLDYLRDGGRGKGKGKKMDSEGKERNDGVQSARQKKTAAKQKNKTEEEVDELQQMLVRILHISESSSVVTVQVTPQVKEVRPFIVCCIVRGMHLKQGNALKRFLTTQTKLHDEICAKRTTATIATHDLSSLTAPLQYDARPPDVLTIVPLSRKEIKASDLLRTLQQEADEQRKQKKRQNVSGLHKYLQLLDGKTHYPCLVDAKGHVISFPPITNSERTKKMAELNKFTFDNKEEACSDVERESGPALDALASSELTVEQVKVVDTEGNLKVVYPSKTDLISDISHLTIIR